MLKARHRPFYICFFKHYTGLMLHRHFHEVRFHGDFVDKGLPVLLIGNHFSWWDGFIAHALNENTFHRRFHVMMLEEQLKNRKFLNKAGAYSIRRGGVSIRESLEYTRELLKDSNNLVVIYPQGEFQSLSKYPVKFEKGISHVLRHSHNKVHVIFYAALVDYFDKRKPFLDIYFMHFEEKQGETDQNVEQQYNLFLEQSIHQQRPDR